MTNFPLAPDLLPLPSVSTEPIAGLYVRHLLGVTDDVAPDEIEALASSRFPATVWESVPTEEQTASGRRLQAGTLRVSRYTEISGPYAPRTEDGLGLGFDRPVDMVYVVVCPRERGAVPFAGGGDRNGLSRVFAEGLPIREERRLSNWLVAAARRLGGTVRFDVADQVERFVVPDPAASVDVTVYSDVWLDPDAALSVCRRANGGAVRASTGGPWEGPTASTGIIPVLPKSPLTPDQLAELHRKADAFDIAALSSPRALSAYAVEVPLGRDGLVSVEVAGVEKAPIVLRGADWAQGGAITYLIRWTPEDLVDWQREIPSFDHRLARTRATGVVAQLAKVIYEAVGGEIADQDDFLLDPQDL